MKDNTDHIFDDEFDDQLDDKVNELIPAEDLTKFGDAEDLETEEEAEEMERRREAYSHLKKADKIFNNSYNHGDPTTDEHDDLSTFTVAIKIDPSSPESVLYDKDKHSDQVDDKIIQVDINNFISQSVEVQEILGLEPEKKKFTKTEINFLFDLIRAGISSGKNQSAFVNPIYIFDVISSVTVTETKKLFDMLTYENKEILLVELDKSYHFLDKASKEFRIYE